MKEYCVFTTIILESFITAESQEEAKEIALTQILSEPQEIDDNDIVEIKTEEYKD